MLTPLDALKYAQQIQQQTRHARPPLATLPLRDATLWLHKNPLAPLLLILTLSLSLSCDSFLHSGCFLPRMHPYSTHAPTLIPRKQKSRPPSNPTTKQAVARQGFHASWGGKGDGLVHRLRKDLLRSPSAVTRGLTAESLASNPKGKTAVGSDGHHTQCHSLDALNPTLLPLSLIPPYERTSILPLFAVLASFTNRPCA
ncbi:hypothetical protein LZ32DRAFT_171606 [Colletotrichum eremochloae]|nr:hypothetical protein LZ32DRAFT_171606 [Colletotrichum eremochloae]